MRIIVIIPGPIGPGFEFDSIVAQSLVAEFRWSGHEVLLVPIFFPLNQDSNDKSIDTEPFLGSAVKIYARHTLGKIVEYIPDSIWNHIRSKKLLFNITRNILKSREKISSFLIDILNGSSGSFKKETNTLCSWLKEQGTFDYAILASPYLLGLASAIKSKLNIPICCFLGTENEDLSYINGEVFPEIIAKQRAVASVPDVLIASSNFQKYRAVNTLNIKPNNFVVMLPFIDNYLLSTKIKEQDASENEIGIVSNGTNSEVLLKIYNYIDALKKTNNFKDKKIHIILYSNVSNRHKNNKEYDAAYRKLSSIATYIKKVHSVSHIYKAIQELPKTIAFIHAHPFPAFNVAIPASMYMKKAILIPDTGSCPEIKAFADGVHMYEDNVDSFCKNVIKLLSSSNLQKDSGEKNYKAVKSFFLPSSASHDIIEDINKTLLKLNPVLVPISDD